MSSGPEFGESAAAFPPVVSEVTLEALRSQFDDEMADGNQTWGERLTEMQEKIIAENPNLADFITEMANRYPRKTHQAVYESVVGVLILLEHQVTSDLD